jgi:hypothetical protein
VEQVSVLTADVLAATVPTAVAAAVVAAAAAAPRASRERQHGQIAINQFHHKARKVWGRRNIYTGLSSAGIVLDILVAFCSTDQYKSAQGRLKSEGSPAQ